MDFMKQTLFIIFAYIFFALSIAFFVIVQQTIVQTRQLNEQHHNLMIKKLNNLCADGIKEFRFDGDYIWATCKGKK